jgi:hypothetical protein
MLQIHPIFRSKDESSSGTTPTEQTYSSATVSIFVTWMTSPGKPGDFSRFSWGLNGDFDGD